MTEPSLNEGHARAINNMVAIVKKFNASQGWNKKYLEVLEVLKQVGREDLIPVVQNYRSGTMIALLHSELSEALEGLRKDHMDDHLTDRKMVEAEMADVMIRLLDFAADHSIPLGDVVIEKDAYNHNREDHKPENRAKVGGKKF